MEQMSGILYICIALPMIPMLFILPDKRSKLFLGYMIIGATVCLVAGSVNQWMLELFGGDGMYVTTNITPISEELMKAIPVLYFAVLFSDDRETLLSIAFALGVGFAVLENAVILTQQISNVTITWALTRVVGAALMHGACTAAVGMGMSYTLYHIPRDLQCARAVAVPSCGAYNARGGVHSAHGQIADKAQKSEKQQWIRHQATMYWFRIRSS